MRIAVISDIHANLPALEAVARDIVAANADETWCLGDVVGYGGSPREVFEWVEKHAALSVKGNHDQAVAAGDVDGFNPVAAAAARCHAQVLSPPERTRLHDLPHEARRSLRVGDTELLCLAVHGSPDDPLREYVYPSAAGRDLARWRGRADVIFLGHTHVPFIAETSAGPAPRWAAGGFQQRVYYPDASGARALTIVNPGSVGQPRDGDPRAAYALVDTTQSAIELRRVSYDVDAAARAIRDLRLDAFLAQRLYRGM